MMNKAISTLVLAMVDSLKKFKGKKLAHFAAIFAMIFGSTGAHAVIYNLGDGHSSPVAELTNGTQVQSTSLSVAGGVIVIDGDGIIDTATDLSIASITTTTNQTTNVITVEAGAKTITVTGAVIGTDADTTNYNLTQAGATIDLRAAVTGGATNAIDFSAASGTTLKLSGDVLYSANFDGAGTLNVTGQSIVDEKIGNAIAMGILDIDGQLTTTATIVNAILDLDGTIVGTTIATSGVANLNGTMTTSGVIGIGGNTTLSGTTQITTSADVVTFTGTVNGAGIDLNINSGTAATNFDATVGNSAGVGAIALTGALDLDAAITDAESITVSLASDLAAAITTTGTAATTITLTDVANISAASVLTTANTNISLEQVTGANTLGLAAGTGNITVSAAISQVTTMTVTSASTATFAAVTNATETQLDSSGTNNFSGILTSPIVDINAGTTTFSGVVTASTSLDVAGASTIVNIDAAPNVGVLNLDAGTVNIGVKDVDIDDLDMDGGTIVIEKTVLSGDSVFKVANQATAGVGATGTIIMPVNLVNGGAITLFNDSGTLDTTAASVDLVVTDTTLTDYTASLVGGDLLITSNDKAAATTAADLGITTNAATALLAARNSAVSDVNIDGTVEDAFYNVLNSQGGFTVSDATALAKQVGPQQDTIGGSSVATRAMTGTVQGIVSNRMASLRSGDAFVTGMSAGNGMSANSGFIQAFGSEAEQKNGSSAGATVFGFDAETSGLAIGFDGMTDDGSTIGLSASYSTTDIEGKGTGKSKNSIDSYTVSAYADKSTENGYIEGSLTYGINDNTASRLINSAGLNRAYTANYDSNQISLNVGGGVPNEVMDGTFITPFVSATATNINTDAYTEKSTVAGDNLRLRVEQDDINSLVGTVGVKAHMVTDKGTPMISLAVNNEFGDNQINSNNTYQGGGTKFKTVTDVEELSATLGLGFSFGNDVTSLNINYEANVNDDEYVNQYGTVKIVAKF